LLEHHLSCCISPSIRIPGEVVVAVSNLRAQRHGAIIVIEQENSVDEYLQGGISISAFVSAAILENIFYPGSPLHDGAVVIRQDQIVKAGCILPLAPLLSSWKLSAWEPGTGQPLVLAN
jgi:diadenylate cyclase